MTSVTLTLGRSSVDKMLQAGGKVIRSSTPLSVEELIGAKPALSVSPAASIFGSSPAQFSPFSRPDNYPVVKDWLKKAKNPHRKTSLRALERQYGGVRAQPTDVEEVRPSQTPNSQARHLK